MVSLPSSKQYQLIARCVQQRTDDSSASAHDAEQSNHRTAGSGAPHDLCHPDAVSDADIHAEMSSMTMTSTQARSWSTSSFGGAPETSALELAALGAHLKRCTPRSKRMFAFRCTGDALNDFAATRIVTVLALFAALGVIATLLS